MINKILFITLSNIGDCILTLPVLDALRERSPEARITVLAGPRAKEIFQDNPKINRFIIYDKHSPLKEKVRLFQELKRENFEMIVDLRNSLWGVFLPSQKKISPFLIIPREIKHMKDRHLYKIPNPKGPKRKLGRVEGGSESQIPNRIKKTSLYIKAGDEEYIKNILKENNIKEEDKIILVAPGARSHTKRWDKEKFVELISSLIKEFGVKVILVGDKDDIPITRYIVENSSHPILDLSGTTTIPQLACLLKRVQLVITNDSATLHLASYLNVPVVAIFGPTNDIKYGPWSGPHAIVKKDIFCRPCEKAQCRFGTLKCMQLIKTEDVLRQVRNILVTSYQLSRMQLCKEVLLRDPEATQKQTLHSGPVTSQKISFKRILIVRTDRIGDVLLSTPVIKTLRDSYPNAYIVTMVSPYTKGIVDGNPYLDEVTIYDKEGSHKSWRRSLKFAQNLKKKRFDLALILHPTNRVHLVTFFAGIRRRIGYDRKLRFLLTDRIRHAKQLGQKHELEYALDLVRYLGIEPKDKTLFMPIKPESEKWVEELFQQEGIKESDKLLAIHPGASCPSKIWPNERFAEVADKLIKRYGFKVLLVAGSKDISLAQNVIKSMHHPANNLAGKTSVSQLASILKRCQLFISNDSGPVHIASAVGTSVISIFGRNQKGLSPVRWGPVGKKDKILHKEVGCIECLAHNCAKDFICLKAITVDDVINAADSILRNE